MATARDHFNALVVCALPTELEAAKRVLENGSDTRFEKRHPSLPHINIDVCEKWNSTPLKVAMASQPRYAGIECHLFVSDLAKYFTANVVIMTGICAGHEKQEPGSVVIAKRTTIESGGKELEKKADGDKEKKADGDKEKKADGDKEKKTEFETKAEYKDLDDRILKAAQELALQDSGEWMKYIPKDAVRPSTRYVQELILKCVLDTDPPEAGIEHRDILAQMKGENLPGMTEMIYCDVLEKMQGQENAWLRTKVDFEHIYIATDQGKGYSKKAPGFPRGDKITAIVDSMATIPNVNEDLKEAMPIYRKRMADRNVKAVDMEAHNFMKQASASFGLAVVMKGISDLGSSASKIDYFQIFAASTSAAFLRHMMTARQDLFEPITTGKEEREPIKLVATGETHIWEWSLEGTQPNICDDQQLSDTDSKAKDMQVTDRELARVAQEIAGCWQDVAVTLDPTFFTIKGRVAIIQSNQMFPSPNTKAMLMLEDWRNKNATRATRFWLIKALCDRDLRAQAVKVFGQELVDCSCPRDQPQSQ